MYGNWEALRVKGMDFRKVWCLCVFRNQTAFLEMLNSMWLHEHVSVRTAWGSRAS